MYHILSSSAAAFVGGGGGGEKRCQIIDILHGMTDERTGALQSPPPASATPLVWLNIKVEGTKLSSLAHDILSVHTGVRLKERK